MRNIFLLPTDKPSSGYILGKCIKELSDVKIGQLVRTHYMMFSNEYFQPQNIYITNDEEIKEGDWYLDLSVFTNNISIGKGIYQMKYSKWGEEGQGDCKKIILTDNEELIADGVQAIDDEFLGWFVKNPSCESDKVERLDTFKKTNEVYVDEIAGGNYYEIIKQYKIIIPQEEPKQKKWDRLHKELDNALEEEPKQDPTLENSKLALREYILANKEKVTEDLQEMWEKSDSGRDETLEEAALSFLPRSEVEHDTDFITGFEFGANWMAERMYSEEELKNAIEISVAKALGVMSFTINEESFEQFKKKQHIK